jgi:hypothetical protein
VEEIYLHKLKDRTQTTATVFMGLTMGCAACHDHKFDPITQADFYPAQRVLQQHAGQRLRRELRRVVSRRLASPAGEARRGESHSRREGRRGTEADCAHASRTGTAGGVDRRRRSPRGCSPSLTDKLQARFRFDEAGGNVVRNSAPGAQPAEFTLAGRDHSWGWFDPAAEILDWAPLRRADGAQGGNAR